MNFDTKYYNCVGYEYILLTKIYVLSNNYDVVYKINYTNRSIKITQIKHTSISNITFRDDRIDANVREFQTVDLRNS